MKRVFCLLCFLWALQAPAQKISMLCSGNGVSIRGLSVVNDRIVWVSGSKGTVGRSVDGGKNWEWMTVPRFEKNDFRDIEAFDAETAVIMSIASPAYILKTTDGGKNWKTVFTDTTKDMFLDAMDFLDDDLGFIIGDPVGHTVYIAYTDDGGSTWSKGPKNLPAYEGEGMFASSGTNIRLLRDTPPNLARGIFVTGGKKSRLFINDQAFDINMLQGKESQGANSVAVDSMQQHMIIVGGDFSNDTLQTGNCILVTQDDEAAKPVFSLPATPPHGYRSCVEFIGLKQAISCGTSGVDISEDDGRNWRRVSTESFHVCRKAKKGMSVFLAGSNGRVAKLEW